MTEKPEMTMGNWLTIIGMVVTIFLSIIGSYTATQTRVAAIQAEQASMRRDLEVTWQELQKKADGEEMERDIKDVKEGVKRLEEIMLLLGGAELKKKLTEE